MKLSTKDFQNANGELLTVPIISGKYFD